MSRSVVVAAVSAVGLWSCKPVLIVLVGDRAGFVETYLLSGVFAVAAGLAVVACRPRAVRLVWRARGELGGAWVDAAVAGACLGLWYYGFYRALMEAPSAPDVVVVAFSWPLIAVLAIGVVTPSVAPSLRWGQWVLLLVSFAGVAAIATSRSTDTASGSGSGQEIWWACAAALGSGVYLPFAMRSSSTLQAVGITGVQATTLSITAANVVAVVTTAATVIATGHTIALAGLGARVVVICLFIGVGVYLVAEVAWTWAMQAGGNLALACLPYFSPACSVLLLAALFGVPVTALTLGGMLVVLVANLTLHLTTGREPVSAPA